MDLGELKRLVDLIYDHSRLYRKNKPNEIVIAVSGKEVSGTQRPFVRIDKIEEGFDINGGLFFLVADENIQRVKGSKGIDKPVKDHTDIEAATLEITKLKKEILKLNKKLLKYQDSTKS